jgi:hypothetical protein
LRRNFAFNMQSLVFSRELLSRLAVDGKVFHTPFPDYYIANVAFGMADRIVAHPRPLTIAGVSRQSFGYTLFNNLEEAGAQLLNTDLKQHESFEKCRTYILPGPAYQTNYVVTMQQVRETLTLIARFEAQILAECGFRLDLSRCAATGVTDDLVYVSPKSGRAVSAEAGAPWRDRLLPLPPFLREDAPLEAQPSAEEIADGFRLTGFFLARDLFALHGEPLPDSRAAFLKAAAQGAR